MKKILMKLYKISTLGIKNLLNFPMNLYIILTYLDRKARATVQSNKNLLSFLHTLNKHIIHSLITMIHKLDCPNLRKMDYQ